MADFATTHWSLVMAAGRQSSPESRDAMADLCRVYWYPLYGYLRSHGRSPADAEDLTQGFFATLLEKRYLRTADRERGRFRSFLLTAFKRYVAKQREHAQAQKRGGGKSLLSLDFTTGESRYQREPTHDWTAEKSFDRRWALTILDRVISELAAEYVAKQKEPLWEHLQMFLTGEAGSPSYAQVAASLEMSEGAIKVAVHRARQRYRELLRQAIEKTVTDPNDVDDELTHLLQSLGGG